MTTQKYKNPPVFAVGVAFTFSPLADERWGECVQFLSDAYNEEFTKRENVIRDNIQILSRSDQGTPTALKGNTQIVRVDFRDEKKQMFSLGPDALAYYMFRVSQEDFPHYQIVLPKALETLSKLSEVVPDLTITGISVTYMNDLRFPTLAEDGPFNLSDYMLLGMSIPETANFGPVFDFNCRTSHALPGDDKGSLQIRLMRAETENHEYRIQVFYTCQIDVDNLPSSDQAPLTTKLDSAHLYCARCFDDSLTLKAKTQFIPIDTP